MLDARAHLTRLSELAGQLPRDGSWDKDGVDISHDEWHATFIRFSLLPVKYYGQGDDPLAADDSQGWGDLADDLADIWRDLKKGLSIYDAGHAEDAASDWAFSFHSHWRQHADDGLRVLNRWAEANGTAPASC